MDGHVNVGEDSSVRVGQRLEQRCVDLVRVQIQQTQPPSARQCSGGPVGAPRVRPSGGPGEAALRLDEGTQEAHQVRGRRRRRRRRAGFAHVRAQVLAKVAKVLGDERDLANAGQPQSAVLLDNLLGGGGTPQAQCLGPGLGLR